MQLPAGVAVRSIDAHVAAVGAEAGMRVAPPFPCVDLRQVEMPQVDPFARLDVIQVGRLHPLLSLGIGIVENPFVAGQVADVPASIEHTAADLLNVPASVLVFKQEVPPVIVSLPVARLREDVGRIAPDEMRSIPVGDDDADIAAVRVGGDHPCQPPAVGIPPAMQGDEPRPVRVEQQMVEVMLDPRLFVGNLSHPGDLSQGDDQLRFAGLQVDVEDTALLRGQVVGVRIGRAVVAIAGTDVGDAAEVGSHGPLPDRADAVDRVRDRASLSRRHVENMADEVVPLPIIPDRRRFRSGQPLEHAALLPVPGDAFPEVAPAVVLFQIDHADFDDVIGPGRAMFKRRIQDKVSEVME